jgi:beta-lactamase class A
MRLPIRRVVRVGVLAALVVAACSGGASDDLATRSGRSTSSSVSTTSTTSSTTTARAPTPTTAAPGATSPTSPVPSTAAGAEAADPSPPPGLQGVVDAFASRQAVPFSVVAIDLTTGERAEHLADRVVLSASLYKLFVARELLRQVADGELTPDAPMGDSQGRTVQECVAAMIVVSDNDCGEAGLARVGYGALDASIHADGYGATSLATPQQTSALDVARFLERARAGTVVGPGREAASRELYGLLQRQQVNDRLPLGLPPGTPIAHKTGDRYHWAHDAGVITTPRGDVLLAVLSGSWPLPCCDADRPGLAEQRAFGAIAELASLVYNALTTS